MARDPKAFAGRAKLSPIAVLEPQPVPIVIVLPIAIDASEVVEIVFETPRIILLLLELLSWRPIPIEFIATGPMDIFRPTKIMLPLFSGS